MENFGTCALSVNRSKPFRYRAYCCLESEVAVKELQGIFMPKCFIKKPNWIHVQSIFFRWTSLFTVIFQALEVWPAGCYLFLILIILLPFFLPALGRASWPVSVLKSVSAQPCSPLLLWPLSDFTHEPSKHPCADVSQICPFPQSFCCLSKLKSFSVSLRDK